VKVWKQFERFKPHRDVSKVVYRLLKRMTFLMILLGLSLPAIGEDTQRPNVVLLFADDLGYGDVEAFNSEGKIPTPQLDALATSGLRFTDAHTASSVCTPSRYSLLTGRYNWRSPLAAGVLDGYSPHLIAPDRMTVADLFRQHGYRTACIGKWHLGMDWARKKKESAASRPAADTVDYGAPLKNGPNEAGFDYFYGISASLDMPPYIFIENDQCVGLPTVEKAFHRPGPAQADFEAVDVLPTIVRKSVQYIDERAADKVPFFLYVPFTSPHTPIVPEKSWQGKSGISPYADFVMQTDDAVGQIADALAKNGLRENTLVLFFSDNGFAPYVDMKPLNAAGHKPSYIFRGYKADIYEGGHRVPLIASWPGQVPGNSSTKALICATDFMATFAGILGADLPETAAVDSIAFDAVLRNPDVRGNRRDVVHHSINGSFAVRQGDWKLVLCPDSGGWSYPRPGRDDTASMPPMQLFDLRQDPGETTNLVGTFPDKRDALAALLDGYIERGRSTPGPIQTNDREVRWDRH
jgi:arylsulfatase A